MNADNDRKTPAGGAREGRARRGRVRLGEDRPETVLRGLRRRAVVAFLLCVTPATWTLGLWMIASWRRSRPEEIELLPEFHRGLLRLAPWLLLVEAVLFVVLVLLPSYRLRSRDASAQVRLGAGAKYRGHAHSSPTGERPP